jgi:hypothetical protein
MNRYLSDFLNGPKWLLVPVISIACCSGAAAAQWQIDPKIQATAIHDDNHHMDSVPANVLAVTGAEVEAGVEFHGRWPSTTLLFAPRLWSSYFPNHSQEDANDQYVTFAVDHDGEKARSAFLADYSRVTLLKQFLPGTTINGDLGQAAPGTTPGKLNVRSRQDLLWAYPTFQLSLSPRSRLLLRADYIDAKYDQPAFGDYTNYTYTSGSAGWAFDVTPRGTLSVTGSGSQFTPAAGSESKTYGLRADWYKRLTEKTRYYLRVGVDRTQFDSVSGSVVTAPVAATNTVSAGAGVSWAFQVTSIFLDATRNVAPNATGYAVQQEQLRLRLQRRYSQRLSGFVGAVGVKDDALGDTSKFVARRYLSGTVGFEWRVQRAFAIAGAYSYSWQKFADDPNNAKSNAFRLAFVYEPHRPADSSAITIGY